MRFLKHSGHPALVRKRTGFSRGFNPDCHGSLPRGNGHNAMGQGTCQLISEVMQVGAGRWLCTCADGAGRGPGAGGVGSGAVSSFHQASQTDVQIIKCDNSAMYAANIIFFTDTFRVARPFSRRQRAMAGNRADAPVLSSADGRRRVAGKRMEPPTSIRMGPAPPGIVGGGGRGTGGGKSAVAGPEAARCVQHGRGYVPRWRCLLYIHRIISGV